MGFVSVAASALLSTADFFGPISSPTSSRSETATFQPPFPYLAPSGLPGLSPASNVALPIATFDGVSQQSIDLGEASRTGYAFSRATVPDFGQAATTIAFWLRIDRPMIQTLAESPSSFNILQCSAASNVRMSLFFRRGKLMMEFQPVGVFTFLQSPYLLPQVGEWVHFAITFEPNFIGGFMNGLSIGLQPTGLPPFLSAPICYLGGRGASPLRAKSSEYLAGAIYGFAIWATKTLSQPEIKTLVGPDTLQQLIRMTQLSFRTMDSNRTATPYAAVPMTTLMPNSQFPTISFTGVSGWDLGEGSRGPFAPPSFSSFSFGSNAGLLGLTFSMWFNANATPDTTQRELLSLIAPGKDEMYLLLAPTSAAGGSIFFSFSISPAAEVRAPFGTYNAAEWTHVVVVIDQSILKAQVNGVRMPDQAIGFMPLQAIRTTAFLGGIPKVGRALFVGQITGFIFLPNQWLNDQQMTVLAAPLVPRVEVISPPTLVPSGTQFTLQIRVAFRFHKNTVDTLFVSGGASAMVSPRHITLGDTGVIQRVIITAPSDQATMTLSFAIVGNGTFAPIPSLCIELFNATKVVSTGYTLVTQQSLLDTADFTLDMSDYLFSPPTVVSYLTYPTTSYGSGFSQFKVYELVAPSLNYLNLSDTAAMNGTYWPGVLQPEEGFTMSWCE